MRGNTPRYFAPGELADYERFLVDHKGTYLVLGPEHGPILACGGFHVAERIAGLTWGMVREGHHRGGLGSLLMTARLEQIRATGTARLVRLDTSQHSRPFFEGFGFQVQSFTPGGYTDGLDRYDMELVLA